jgi:hypothetical protein
MLCRSTPHPSFLLYRPLVLHATSILLVAQLEHKRNLKLEQQDSKFLSLPLTLFKCFDPVSAPAFTLYVSPRRVVVSPSDHEQPLLPMGIGVGATTALAVKPLLVAKLRGRAICFCEFGPCPRHSRKASWFKEFEASYEAPYPYPF